MLIFYIGRGPPIIPPSMKIQVLSNSVLFPTLSVPNISFSLEPLHKILQGTKVLKDFISCA